MSVQSKTALQRASSRMSSVIASSSSVTAITTTLRDALARILPSSSGSLLPFIPKPLKAFLLLLVILNSPSFPFQWHIRVWYHAIKAYYLVWRKGRTKYLDDWEKRNIERGQVKGVVTVMKRIAWVDDCDYNMHLSNSCYAKNSDPARMDYCIQSLSPGFTPGIAMALAGSHFIYIKEIPIGSEYTMETRVIGWGDKWYYPVTEFIIYPKKGTKSKSRGQDKGKDKRDASSAITSTLSHAESKLSTSPGLPAPTLGEMDITPSTTSSVGDSGIATPLTKPDSRPGSPADKDASGLVPIQDLEEAKRAALRQRPPRADGGVVACVAVWEYCFKIGRLTVPPRIALYVSLQSPSAADRAAARKIILSKDRGRAWVSGGWKKEPNADEIGRDIGLTEAEYKAASSGQNPEDGANGGEETWIVKGRKAMETMTLGLASI